MKERIIDDNGSTIYRVDGKVHRANGPAILNGAHWKWYMNEVAHRYYGHGCSWLGYWWIHGAMIK